MATFSVDFVVGKIVSLLENEASLLEGVRDELSATKCELESMRSFLHDADRKRALTEVEKTWVANVSNIAYDVEDIIDKFLYHMNRPQGEGKFTRFIYQTSRLPKNLWEKHQMATKLQKINTQIKAIPERSQRYGVDRIDGISSHDDHNWVRNLGESSLFLSDDDVVGIEDDGELLVRWLTDEEEPQRTVISLVGMGGSGKTTLVAKAYNGQTVKRHFNCCAWITVSQTYVIEDVFRNMIKEFYQATKELIPPDLSTMSYRRLVEMLINYLELKRYVVVLDDVWNMNLWTEIKVSLPDGRHGSRILLTTRKEDIANSSFGAGSHVHHIRPLGKDEAWILFCKKAFSRNPNSCCPPELESIGRGLVEKCKGLPLAIVALGGLMSSKQLEWEWSIVRNSLNWELSNNPMLEVVKSILFLSFNDLSYRLKQCFLYCCVFPEDFLIRRKRLIRLWMAEGFVEEIRGSTLEEVAEKYLVELIRRSMLQVERRNPFGLLKVCKMHDIMRELALSTSEREKFCNVYDGREDIIESEAHRLSIQIGAKRMKLPTDMSRLRSFFVFTKHFASFVDVPHGFRLLRILDMEDCPIDKLPDGLENLFNLRYLNLKRSRIKDLPKSIGRLRNLQTLNIRYTLIEALPRGIVKLNNLQYLIMSQLIVGWKNLDDFDFEIGIQTPSDICKLKNLRELYYVKAGDIIRQVSNMTQLRSFGITDVREVDEMDLCTSIQKMKLLRSLFVMVTKEDKILRMDALSSPPPHLRKLYLGGILQKVPHWFHSLQNITRLKLQWSRLREDPLPYIQALPNLEWLILADAYEGKQLCFRTGFQKLKRLGISEVLKAQLNEIFIEKGVMPGLLFLDLLKCEELKTLPQGIEHLTNLQEMNLTYVSEEFIERIDYSKVQHIPDVNYTIIRVQHVPTSSSQQED